MQTDSSWLSPFHSFWMGGYECTDQLNAFGNRVDFLHITGHLERLDKDYEDLSLFNIKTVREGIRWSVVEKQPHQYDWSTVATMMEAAKKHDIQQIWDICHFGFPDDLTPLHPHFAGRFADVCRAFVRFYRTTFPTETLIVTPINEVSFISWLGGDVRGTSPYCIKQGWDVKYALMRAYIEGVAAMKEEDPLVKIMTTEPLVNMVPPQNATPEEISFAQKMHSNQFQAADMLTGRICPELGGKPEYLDILGLNFYFNNQWIVNTDTFLPWLNEFPDWRWKPLHQLLQQVYARYQKPIVLSETSHSKEDRFKWIRYIGRECQLALQQHIPLWGVCWYPVIDRPDWDHLTPWHNSGLWDANSEEVNSGIPSRELHVPTATAFLNVQQQLANFMENTLKGKTTHLQSHAEFVSELLYPERHRAEMLPAASVLS